MEAATIHQLYPEGEIPEGYPQNLSDAIKRITELEQQIANDYARRDAEDRAEGYKQTVEIQSRRIGTLERKVAEDADPMAHPKGAEISALLERWKVGTGKSKAVIGGGRVKLVKARLRDGFPLSQEDDEPAPSLELAIDGLIAFPYRVYDRRHKTGRKADLDNDLSAALKDEKHVENMARLGWQARQEGWTMDGGWPA